MDQILCGNEWIELRLKDGWYSYAHQPKGDGVSVLGYKKVRDIYSVEDGYMFLARQEHTPPHGVGFRRTSLTGTIEAGYDPMQTAIKELKEESGYSVEDFKRWIYFGWAYPMKSTDYKLHLFAVDLTDLEAGKIEGDGTLGEVGATVEWVAEKDILATNSLDFMALLAHFKK